MSSPLGIRVDERTAVFIDGPNLYAAAKQNQVEMDYKKMLTHFEDESRFVRASYYTAVTEDSEDYSPIRPLIDWLGYNGYNMVTKPMKEFSDESGRRRHKGSMAVELAVDVMNLSDKLDHVVLFSGDGEGRPRHRRLDDEGHLHDRRRASPPSG
jgi:uncharacterized LabA/DUF88 family protein